MVKIFMRRGRLTLQFQNFPNALLDSLEILSRQLSHASVESLLGNRSDLVRDCHYIAAITAHWHQQGRAGSRRAG
jgi:hypothetical protein